MVKLLPIEAVMAKIGIGRTMVYKLVNEDGFPPPLKIGRCSRWMESDVDSWLMKIQQKQAR